MPPRKPKQQPAELPAEPAAAGPLLRIPTLDDLLGQSHAVNLLRAAADSGRIHHAWIFHGPPGVGKHTAALAFASLLLDPTTAPDLSGKLAPDPDSPTQQLLRAGAHPDLHLITKELAAVSREQRVRDSKQRVISVDVVREFLIEPAQRTRAVVAKTLASKVFIVDEAELLRHDAQDVMLKTLEEPAPGSIIILITPSEDRLLPTVRSRCQRIAFSALDDESMRAWYKQSAMPQDPPEMREWLLRLAAGSPGWVASAVEHGLYAWHQTLAPMLESLDAGRPVPELGGALHALVEDKAASWVKANPDASKEAANHAWARRMFAYLAERYRLAHRDNAHRPGAGERYTRVIDAIAAAETHAATNVNLQFVMENLSAQLTTRLARPPQPAAQR